ncbi:hypothetical protein GNI_073350 [Gregarina niphandrodes]|uniref:Uncharacterized protein n=1 Tax=Gregarina niphandrodes TaxID=110365 RepID=A0A023B741_GRENI|nr:hypothetical protein GNI_073350 [Gregarina niphandrodes]EZG66968.1 hypothetical protein GNI_073350 [Gregarina niphandrodes]|eukprot:XP_011130405.1 hypothetical protein GNI_073350 [Gregarina niphandrodes]
MAHNYRNGLFGASRGVNTQGDVDGMIIPFRDRSHCRVRKFQLDGFHVCHGQKWFCVNEGFADTRRYWTFRKIKRASFWISLGYHVPSVCFVDVRGFSQSYFAEKRFWDMTIPFYGIGDPFVCFQFRFGSWGKANASAD